MSGNYDAIAKTYDLLNRIVFGQAPVKAQLFLAKAIPEKATVLIVGGGSGWILETIAGLHPSGLRITYADASAKMIAIARNRNAGDNVVTFVTGDIANVILTGKYDVVLTPYLFDNFTEQTARKVFSILDNHLAANGLWLYCDFRNTEVFWQKAVLKIMYFFFRAVIGIESSGLPEMQTCFNSYGYELLGQKLFVKGLVTADIYRKMADSRETP